MKNFFLLLSLSFLCVACSISRQAAPSETVRVETRIETVFSVDTVFIERPGLIERVQTLDTVSVLDNRYARSEASVSAGVLTHSLEAKPVREPVPVEVKTVYRDSLVYVDKVLTQTVEVPAKISRWQQLMIRLGAVCFSLLILLLIYLCTKYILKFIIH